MGRSTLTVFAHAVLGAGVETVEVLVGQQRGGGGGVRASRCPRPSPGVRSAGLLARPKPKVAIGQGDDRAKIGGTGVDIRDMGTGA